MRNITIPQNIRRIQELLIPYNQIPYGVKSHIRKKLTESFTEDPVASVVIPAWNEADNIVATISSLVEQKTSFPFRLLVVNNNSSDSTEHILIDLGVEYYNESMQGIGYARQRGLIESKGKYILCADADCIYPDTWVEQMILSLKKRERDGATAVFGSYSFLPSDGTPRWVYCIYEALISTLHRLKTSDSTPRRVMGFNFAFLSEEGKKTNGFLVGRQRRYRNKFNSNDFVLESEDGKMARALMNAGGKVLPVYSAKARIWTSDRRIVEEGGFFSGLHLRVKKFVKTQLFRSLIIVTL
jgi:glycosyltransferase involved in cell wall biosynthesis